MGGVKWSYKPVRAEDVPYAFMRAYAIATQKCPTVLAAPISHSQASLKHLVDLAIAFFRLARWTETAPIMLSIRIHNN